MILTKPEIALIDGDILRYEIGSLEIEHPYVPDLRIPPPVDWITNKVNERIQGMLDAVGCLEYAIYITGTTNFRFDVAKLEPYKGHRAGKEKPYHWSTVDEHLRTHWNCIEVNGNEADDVLAMTQRAYLDLGTMSVICSRDKDLRMVEGWHYSWACGENQPEKPLYQISKDQGERFFYKQLLTGDGTDNIMGCGHREDAIWKTGLKAGQPYRRRKGIGDTVAERYINSCSSVKEMFDIVCTLYQAEFQDLWKERLLEMGQLLYIGQTHNSRWELPDFNEESNDRTTKEGGDTLLPRSEEDGVSIPEDQRVGGEGQ